MKRTVIKIDEELCNGCGNCVSGCHEGALQLVAGKAVMISDLYCDGLGACIGECPAGGISFEEREAEPYDERAVIERLITKGEAAVAAHLNHLKDHGETGWYQEGLEYLGEKGIDVAVAVNDGKKLPGGCPGSMSQEIKREIKREPFQMPATFQRSELSHFPIQLSLINPGAGFFRGSDLLLAADCTAFASGEFHSRILKGKALTIACPKLDDNLDLYRDKIIRLIDEAGINTLTVAIMEVPCCRGLLQLAEQAQSQAKRKISVEKIIVSVSGEVI